MEEVKEKGKVCLTGGSGYLGSWMVTRLLQVGYSVNTTIRSHPDCKKDVSYLTNLPGAQERLHIFNADLARPESFKAAIEGCIGVFHVAHPMELENKESEEMITQRSIDSIIGILQACIESKTVKRVVYTSSAATVAGGSSNIIDENSWTDVDLIRTLKPFASSYTISKTLTEKAALEFAELYGIDLVTLIPTWIHGPFITPQIPGSVRSSMEMILGHQNNSMSYPPIVPFVHVDDVTNAHIFLLENPNAKGRYICSAVEITREKLAEFLSTRYPEYRKQINEYTGSSVEQPKHTSLSSKKLLEIGFKYKYGLEEMFDGAIECCKQKGIL
ncbi:vestitone reductase-like isoform X2 [Lycium barbarum]|uniref:vestitone reductase-like isoform X2 n=1 Tax=Lycium barbarum TaxID=112863 RepID=UPI00293F603E|nr:vestitone reductase-like isoform X2 [Lycium barbarum]